MAPKNRIIIDTDPGVDDVLAILLALSASSAELEVLLISLTFGNVDVRSCLRNVVAIFSILDQELAWRRAHSLKPGFEGVTHFKPLISVGADEPLQDRIESADYFHGTDGLAGIHSSHPHLSPDEGWRKLFEQPPADGIITQAAKEVADSPDLKPPAHFSSFTPSLQPSHTEILRLLRSNPPNTITLIALGPCTNYALAAAEDPATFLRCKEIVVMGGVVAGAGNVTPVAEFNVFADPYAAAALFALSSPKPSSTAPVPIAGERSSKLNPYPEDAPTTTTTDTTGASEGSTGGLGKPLVVKLMSLDITEFHSLSRAQMKAKTTPLIAVGSPLATWLSTFMTPMLDKMEQLHEGHEGDGAALALHDPLCIWYVLTRDDPRWKASDKSPEDIRVETGGQWSRGMTVGDGRDRKRRDSDGEVPHDRGNWLGRKSGNRIWRMLESPGRERAAVEMLDRIFGC